MVIRRTGPIPATTPVSTAIAFFTPSGRLLNASAIFETISTIGVMPFKKASPIGAIEILSFSIDA